MSLQVAPAGAATQPTPATRPDRPALTPEQKIIALTWQLSAPTACRREEAFEALVEMGAAAVPYLEPAAQHLDLSRAIRAQFVLRAIRDRAGRMPVPARGTK